MQNYTLEDMEKAIDELPADVSEAITDPSVGEKIRAIGKKYNLHIDQLGSLMGATNLVMIGLIPPEEFKTALREKVGIDDMTAGAIASDISEQIIKDIREKMKVHEEIGQKFTDEELDALLDQAEEEIAGTPDQFAQTGIEILESHPIPDEAAPDMATPPGTTPAPKSATTTFAPQITAEEIERGITGEKLAGSFKMPKEERDYSVTRSAPEPGAGETIIRHKDRVDPYHEPIE